jgi:Cu2+-exporting ATPase
MGDGGTAARECYHCGLPVPEGSDFQALIEDEPRAMCCAGCQAVADAIVAAGHAAYYRYRSNKALPPDDTVPAYLRRLETFDRPRVQQRFVRSDEDSGSRQASLILEGIHCAACVWLSERHLRSLPGVLQADVNYATRRAQVSWDPTRIQLSEILRAISDIGYIAHPYDPQRHEALAAEERRRQLMRIGVAGALGMQIMMIAIALYFGRWSGIEDQYRVFFHWISLLLCIPILLYSAQPFFAGAWRDLRHRRVGMDVPVALGIGIAFAGSAWATWTGSGEVYYESVAMFVFLLLCARHFESVARHRSAAALETMTRSVPQSAVRLTAAGDEERVLAAELRRNDTVLVPPGATIPADGLIVSGSTTVDEALISGESRPVTKRTREEVIAGSINLEHPVTMLVSRVCEDTLLSKIMQLAERAQAHKPRLARLADRAASLFITAVLVLATGVALYWWQRAPEAWIAVTVSVLVVTCPCALSLATPAAMTAAMGRLTGLGVVVMEADALEVLPRVDHFVFDKTGTLTLGALRLEAVVCPGDWDPQRAVATAAALEQGAAHPVADALRAAARGKLEAAGEVRHQSGGGVSGRVAGHQYHLGSIDYLRSQSAAPRSVPPSIKEAAGGHSTAYLADASGILAGFTFSDRVRREARSLIRYLQAQGIAVSLYSGDRVAAVADVAATLGIEDFHAGLTPAAKLQALRQLQDSGKIVAMLGDGINDAPVLAAARVSFAMGGGADLARTNADLVMVSDNLTIVADCMSIARRTRRVVRENLVWAAGYNLLALPAAAVGMVPPWLAAIGMSLSSLLVIGNALRLTHVRPASPAVAAETGDVAYA